MSRYHAAERRRIARACWAACTENKEVQAFLADIFLNGDIAFRQQDIT